MRGETVTFITDAYSADGRVIEYEATLLPIVSNRRVVGMYGLLENITERMRAERTIIAQREELLDLEHDFRSIFERNPDGMVLLSTDGVILDLNESLVQLSRRSHEEIAGQSFRAFLQGEDLERGWSFFRRAVEGEPVRFEVVSTRGDGERAVLDATMFPKYAQGLVVGIYCVITDITERKAALRKLEIQTQRPLESISWMPPASIFTRVLPWESANVSAFCVAVAAPAPASTANAAIEATSNRLRERVCRSRPWTRAASAA